MGRKKGKSRFRSQALHKILDARYSPRVPVRQADQRPRSFAQEGKAPQLPEISVALQAVAFHDQHHAALVAPYSQVHGGVPAGQKTVHAVAAERIQKIRAAVGARGGVKRLVDFADKPAFHAVSNRKR